ncbi:MAG: heavy metal-binding domain-containing protein [Acidimicrobiales bacterium]
MSGPATPDNRAEMLRAATWLAENARTPDGHGQTSDLSIDEALLLHSASWEPIDLVFGVGCQSIQAGAWVWGRGEIHSASDAQNAAVHGASARIAKECARVGGHGVVGVHLEMRMQSRHVTVELVGTAIRPVGQAKAPAAPFVSDLSARDFTLMSSAGWAPVGLSFGAAYIYAPRRDAATAMRQSTQNVELTNLTEALYAARESAMDRMQTSGQVAGAQGIVGVRVSEGPVPFASHVIGFSAWGTAVRLVADAHTYIQPQVVLPLDDAVVQFDAASLRGE